MILVLNVRAMDICISISILKKLAVRKTEFLNVDPDISIKYNYHLNK